MKKKNTWTQIITIFGVIVIIGAFVYFGIALFTINKSIKLDRQMQNEIDDFNIDIKNNINYINASSSQNDIQNVENINKSENNLVN